MLWERGGAAPGPDDASGGERRRAVRITGRVQSVGFRWWARHTARELGVRGTVRNAGDGSVEVRMAGPEDAVNRFVRALEKGSGSARVQEIRDGDLPTGDLPGSFEIVR